jgi:septum formation protein
MQPAVAHPSIILASQSPRRRQLLSMLGLNFDAAPADIDETYVAGEEPGAHAERLAREKALAVVSRYPQAIVVGSDTVVIVDGDVLGKPRDEDAAVEMLLRLQGRTHEVATGIAVCSGGNIDSGVERVAVTFRRFDESTARAYVETGEPMDKAGSYGIQGYGATLVEHISGDFFAVMGFPIVRFTRLLAQSGWIYDFREGLRRAGKHEDGNS